MQISESPSVISERALALALRLRIAELDDNQHAWIGSSAIPDRLASPPDTSAAWICGAYAVVLSRTPDDEGLAGFRQSFEAGLPPEFLLRELRNTREGRDRRAKVPADTRDIFVIGCYLLALGRGPTPTELLEARAALDHGQSLDDYLAMLTATGAARRALRSPPASPDRNAAIAVAIQRATGHAVDRAVTSRLLAGLVAGESVTQVLHSEMHRHSRHLRARIWTRLTLQSMVAQVESIAAGLLAQQESALTRDLIWRIKLTEWRDAPPADDASPSQPWSQWYR